MTLFIKISMWLSLVEAIFRMLVVALKSDYPRIVTYERYEDMIYIAGGLCWTFWAWSLIYR